MKNYLQFVKDLSCTLEFFNQITVFSLFVQNSIVLNLYCSSQSCNCTPEFPDKNTYGKKNRTHDGT